MALQGEALCNTRVLLLCVLGLAFFATLTSAGAECDGERRKDPYAAKERPVRHPHAKKRPVRHPRDPDPVRQRRRIPKDCSNPRLNTCQKCIGSTRQCMWDPAKKGCTKPGKGEDVPSRSQCEQMEMQYAEKLQAEKNRVQAEKIERLAKQERVKTKKRLAEEDEAMKQFYLKSMQEMCGGETQTPILLTEFTEMTLDELQRVVPMKIQCSQSVTCYDADTLFQLWQMKTQSFEAFVDPLKNVPYTPESIQGLLAKVGEPAPTPSIWRDPWELRVERVRVGYTVRWSQVAVEFKQFDAVRNHEIIHISNGFVPIEEKYRSGKIKLSWREKATKIEQMVKDLHKLQRLYTNNNPNQPRFHLNKPRSYWVDDRKDIGRKLDHMIAELQIGLKDQPGYSQQC